MPEVPEQSRAGQREAQVRAAAGLAGATLPAPVSTSVAAWIEYFRDLGIRDFYRVGEPPQLAAPEPGIAAGELTVAAQPESPVVIEARPEPPRAAPAPAPPIRTAAPAAAPPRPAEQPAPPDEPPTPNVPAPIPFDKLAPPPATRIPAANRPAALQ